jgi:hypothetical protein
VFENPVNYIDPVGMAGKSYSLSLNIPQVPILSGSINLEYRGVHPFIGNFTIPGVDILLAGGAMLFDEDADIVISVTGSVEYSAKVDKQIQAINEGAKVSRNSRLDLGLTISPFLETEDIEEEAKKAKGTALEPYYEMLLSQMNQPATKHAGLIFLEGGRLGPGVNIGEGNLGVEMKVGFGGGLPINPYIEVSKDRDILSLRKLLRGEYSPKTGQFYDSCKDPYTGDLTVTYGGSLQLEDISSSPDLKIETNLQIEDLPTLPELPSDFFGDFEP